MELVDTGESPAVGGLAAGSASYPGSGFSSLPVLPAPPAAAAAGAGGAALLLTNGALSFLSLPEGRILWSRETRLGTGEAELLFDERGICILTKTGAAGYSGTGEERWFLRLPGAAALPGFSEEGILYAGGGDWILYAYRPEDQASSGEPSFYGPAPEGDYGTGRPPPSSQAAYYFRWEEAELNRRFRIIGGAVRAGEIGEQELEYTAYLMEAASGRAEDPRKDIHPPVHTRHRAEAVRLLGRIGSRETVPFLTGVFLRDRDPAVKAAAAEAIGRIGVDPGGRALGAFRDASFPPAPPQDEQVLAAVAAAAGALCRFSGPPLSETGVRILTALAAEEQPPRVRSRARRELSTLR
jgi:outer membrane protein assembly factor BamB